MNYFLILLSFLLYYLCLIESINCEAEFISIWNTELIEPVGTGPNQIQLPLVSDGIYNFTINWGDGSNNIITA